MPPPGSPPRRALSPWLGLCFALALTGLAALAIGMLTLRLGGHFLPLSTIAWGLSIALLFGNVDALGRHTGLSNIPPLRIAGWSLAEPRAIYYLIWVLVGLAFAVQPQPAAVAAGPRDPQPARRRDAAGERRRRCVSRAAHAVRPGGAARRPRRLAVRAHEPLRQPVALRRAGEHRVPADGGGRRPRPARRRAGRRGRWCWC